MMKRRTFVLAAAAGLTASVPLLRPRDHGGRHDAYFANLQGTLQRAGISTPRMVIDLDRLDSNIIRLREQMPASQHYRLVAKSLPSPQLIEHVLAGMNSTRLMSFHQPFLSQCAAHFPQSDILLGKPMPVQAAAMFYRQLPTEAVSTPMPAHDPQWLIDTPERLQQYQQLAQTLGKRLRISIEIDVGLHRGGVQSTEAMQAILQLLAQHPAQLQLAGFMGYDAHVGKIPAIIESRDSSFSKSQQRYQAYLQQLQTQFPALWRDDLILNGAGSPTITLHTANKGKVSHCNDLSAGSCLLKPSDFELPTLAGFEAAAFIATPVLKRQKGITIPGIESVSGLFSFWDVNQAQSFFIYGGRWLAKPVSPPGLQPNSMYGESSNQAILNGSESVALQADDRVFLRPTQSESVLLQFGDLLVVSQGQIVDQWPVFHA